MHYERPNSPTGLGRWAEQQGSNVVRRDDMNHSLVLASTGEEITFGRTVQAVAGPYMGTWWRLDALHTHEDGHKVAVSRHTRLGRHVLHCPPEIFGLLVRELTSWFRHVRHDLHVAFVRCADGLYLGALALIPLAVFEAYHGAEVTRHLLEALFNSHANSGGGH